MSGYAMDQKHYCAFTPIEIMQKLMSPEELQGFLKGNTIKYLLRAESKGQYESDMEKSRQYLWWLKLAQQGKPISANDIPPENWEGYVL